MSQLPRCTHVAHYYCSSDPTCTPPFPLYLIIPNGNRAGGPTAQRSHQLPSLPSISCVTLVGLPLNRATTNCLLRNNMLDSTLPFLPPVPDGDCACASAPQRRHKLRADVTACNSFLHPDENRPGGPAAHRGHQHLHCNNPLPSTLGFRATHSHIIFSFVS